MSSYELSQKYYLDSKLELFFKKIGVPETIRTSDLPLRRRLLYPAELRGLNLMI